MVFSLFAGERQCLALALPAKIHSFRPRSRDKSHSFGKCARHILEVTASKISIFNAFIKLLIFTKSGSPFFFGCSVTLLAVLSSLRRQKMCAKARSHMCPHSACSAKNPQTYSYCRECRRAAYRNNAARSKGAERLVEQSLSCSGGHKRAFRRGKVFENLRYDL